jgi:HdeA/HdeB family protein
VVRTKILALAPAALALAFSASAAMNKVDATKITCGDFATQNPEQQKRTIAFLQGYARKDMAEDSIGQVMIGGDRATIAASCAAAPDSTAWQKVQQTLGDEASGSPSGHVATSPGDSKMGSPPQPGAMPAPPSSSAGVTHAEPTKMTCQQYEELSSDAQRGIVYWLDGYSRKTDPSAATASLVDLDRNVTTLTEACRATPNERLWSTLRTRLPSTPSAG